MHHGHGGSKYGYNQLDSQPGRTKDYAKRGYAVLSLSARGVRGSCGTPQSRASGGAACLKGWNHLDDARKEARDTQHLAGLPGVPMRIAAAAPSIPGSDLAYSLVPNGRTFDYVIAKREDDIAPVGVVKATYVAGFYGTGQSTGGGYYAPPFTDPSADINNWYARLNAGEPYDADLNTNPGATYIADQIARFHSGYNIDTSVAPAPMIIANGFTASRTTSSPSTRPSACTTARASASPRCRSRCSSTTSVTPAGRTRSPTRRSSPASGPASASGGTPTSRATAASRPRASRSAPRPARRTF